MLIILFTISYSSRELPPPLPSLTNSVLQHSPRIAICIIMNTSKATESPTCLILSFTSKTFTVIFDHSDNLCRTCGFTKLSRVSIDSRSA